MPKLKPDTQRARREHILEAAELCFARAGFHRTTMQDICKEAAVSPGALYVYFDSKEALIAGICERDRAEFAENFASLAEAPDFLGTLAAMGEEYFVNQPAHKRLMCVEIGLESTRNPRVAEIFAALRQLHQRELPEAVPATEGRGPHRPRARYPVGHARLHGDLRRHVLATRRSTRPSTPRWSCRRFCS